MSEEAEATKPGAPKFHSTPRRLNYDEEFQDPSSPPLLDRSAALNNSRALETSFATLRHNDELMRENKAALEKVSELEGGLTVSEARISSLEAELRGGGRPGEAAEAGETAEGRGLRELETELLRAERRAEEAERREAEAASKEAWLRDELAHQAEDRQGLQSRAAQLEKELAEERAALQRLRPEKAELAGARERAEKEAAEARRCLEELRRELALGQSTEAEVGELREELRKARAVRDEAALRADASVARADSAELHLQRKTEEIAFLRSEISQGIGSSIDALRVQIQAKDKALAENSVLVDRLKCQVEKLKLELDAAKTTPEWETEKEELERAKKDSDEKAAELAAELAEEKERGTEWKQNAEAQFTATVAEFEERLTLAEQRPDSRATLSLLESSLNATLWSLIPKAIQDGLTSLKGDAKELHHIVQGLKGARLDVSSIMDLTDGGRLSLPQPSPSHAPPTVDAASSSSPSHMSFKTLEERVDHLTKALAAAPPTSRRHLVDGMSKALSSLLTPKEADFREGLQAWVREWSREAAAKEQRDAEQAQVLEEETEKSGRLRRDVNLLRTQLGQQEEEKVRLETELEKAEEEGEGLRERLREANGAMDLAQREAKERLELWQEARDSQERCSATAESLHAQAQATVAQLGQSLRASRESEGELRSRLAQTTRLAEELRREMASQRAQASLLASLPQTHRPASASQGPDRRALLSQLQLAQGKLKGLLFQTLYLKKEVLRLELWAGNNPESRPPMVKSSGPLLKVVATALIAAIRMRELRRRHARKGLPTPLGTPRALPSLPALPQLGPSAKPLRLHNPNARPRLQ